MSHLEHTAATYVNVWKYTIPLELSANFIVLHNEYLFWL